MARNCESLENHANKLRQQLLSDKHEDDFNRSEILGDVYLLILKVTILVIKKWKGM